MPCPYYGYYGLPGPTGLPGPDAHNPSRPAVRAVRAAREDLQRNDLARLHLAERFAERDPRARRRAVDGDDDIRAAWIFGRVHAPVGRAVRRYIRHDEPAARVDDRPQARVARVLRGELVDRKADSLFPRRLARGPAAGRRGHDGVGVGGRARQAHRERLPRAALTEHGHGYDLARLLEAHPLLELRHVVDRLAVERHDHVPRLDPGLLRRRVVGVAVHDDSLDLLEPDRVRVFRRRLSDLDAHHGALHVPGLHELLHHRARQVDRNGEAVARVESRLARDGRVDADDLALDVHEWAARIARVDRGVGLDEVMNRVAPIRAESVEQ